MQPFKSLKAKDHDQGQGLNKNSDPQAKSMAKDGPAAKMTYLFIHALSVSSSCMNTNLIIYWKDLTHLTDY